MKVEKTKNWTVQMYCSLCINCRSGVHRNFSRFERRIKHDLGRISIPEHLLPPAGIEPATWALGKPGENDANPYPDGTYVDSTGSGAAKLTATPFDLAQLLTQLAALPADQREAIGKLLAPSTGASGPQLDERCALDSA